MRKNERHRENIFSMSFLREAEVNYDCNCATIGTTVYIVQCALSIDRSAENGVQFDVVYLLYLGLGNPAQRQMSEPGPLHAPHLRYLVTRGRRWPTGRRSNRDPGFRPVRNGV